MSPRALSTLSRLKKTVRKLRRDQDGSVSIEMALWLPLFMGLVLVVGNTSMVFYGQSQAMRVVQDGNRAFSVGRIQSIEDTEAFVTAGLAPLSADAVVTTTLYEGVVYTVAKIPVQDLARLGTLDMFSNYDVTVASQMFVEY